MIRLTMNEEQAKIVSLACEFYARIRMGQFNEIVWHLLDIKIPSGEYCERREKAENLLLEARKQLYPDLHGAGHSYGIGKFDDADMAFGVHEVIRYEMRDGRPPFSYHELPTCERVEQSSSAATLSSAPTQPSSAAQSSIEKPKFCKECKHGNYMMFGKTRSVYCYKLSKYFPPESGCYKWEKKQKPN